MRGMVLNQLLQDAHTSFIKASVRLRKDDPELEQTLRYILGYLTFVDQRLSEKSTAPSGPSLRL
jgi:hypothetical protein